MSECEAHRTFDALSSEILEKYMRLAPSDKLFHHLRGTSEGRQIAGKLDDDGVIMEYLRGGIVAIVSAWEEYVHDLFEEAFEVFIDECSTGPEGKSINYLHKRWPTFRTIIENETKRKLESEKKDGGRAPEVLFFDLLLKQDDSWREMLNNHCHKILDQGAFLPIFDCQDDRITSIDGLFQRLFFGKKQKQQKQKTEVDDEREKAQKRMPKNSKRKSLSEYVIEVGFHYDMMAAIDERRPEDHGSPYEVRMFEFRIPHTCTSAQVGDFSRVGEGTLDLFHTIVNFEAGDHSTAVEALCYISHLYYGVRCVFVHGKHQKTVRSGALRIFSELQIDNFPLPSQSKQGHAETIKSYYINLFQKIKKDGRKARVSYITLLNAIKFYIYAADFLKKAIAKGLYDVQCSEELTPICIWGYEPPPRVQQHQSADEARP